LIDNDARL